MSLAGVYEVTNGSENFGTLKIKQENLLTVFEFESARAFPPMRLVCLGDGALSVGIPAPKNGMYLKKSFTGTVLKRAGLTFIKRCVLIAIDEDIPSLLQHDEPLLPVMAEAPSGNTKPEESSYEPPAHEEPDFVLPDIFSPCGIEGWLNVSDPSELFDSLFLKEQLRGITGALVSTPVPPELLALPYSPRKEFPLLTGFILGAADNIGGKDYIVYRISDIKEYE